MDFFSLIPDWLIKCYAFIIGVCVGSFLNVCILRIPEGQKIGVSRSECPACKHKLNFFDLIPLMSYIMLLGKCRYCKTKISERYFIVELLTGLLFLFGVIKFPPLLFFKRLLLFEILSAIMIIVTFIDIDHYIINDRFSIGLFFFGILISSLSIYPLNLAYLYSSYLTGVWYKLMLNSLIGGLTGGGIFFLIFFISNKYYEKQGIEAFGFGDVKLTLGIGTILGWKLTLVMIFLSFFCGIALAVPSMIFSGKGLRSQIPFAPAICVSTLFTYVYGEKIINWYLSFGSVIIV
jgi:leader peptidase (prepilin peptidase)/N-methyltransferase